MPEYYLAMIVNNNNNIRTRDKSNFNQNKTA